MMRSSYPAMLKTAKSILTNRRSFESEKNILTEEIVTDCLKILKSEPIRLEIKDVRIQIREKESKGQDSSQELNKLADLQKALNEIINIINNYCLIPILGIEDINNDERIRFIAGCHGLESLEKKVNQNNDSVAFSIFPSQIEDVMRVADNKLTMPPKSTWFDPKPLDGLVVYEFDQMS